MSTPPAGTDYPGKTLGIVAIIVAFFISILGLILGVVANNQSKAAGFKNTPAKVAIILGAIFLVIGVISIIISVVTGGIIATSNLGG